MQFVGRNGEKVTGSYGVTGQWDLRGYVCADPAVPFEIEVKTGGDRLKPEQEGWGEMLERMGVPHLVLKIPAEADLDAKVREAAEWVQTLGR